MNRYPGVPELLETFMEEQAVDERWVTVHELRDHFGLTRYQSNTVSAFLRRLSFGPFGRFPFVVASILHEKGGNQSDPKKNRYLLVRRRLSPLKRRAMAGDPVPELPQENR